jgi:hypothetical protein
MGLWDGWRSRLFGDPDGESEQLAASDEVQTAESAPEPTPATAGPPDFSDAVPGRQERAAGRILDDEGVRGDLTDDEYQPLLDWALSVTDLVAAGTATLDDDEAEPVLDHGISIVRQVLRLAQEVILAHAEDRADDRRYALDDISQAWKPSLLGGNDADAPRTVWQPLQALADRLDAEPGLAGTDVTAQIVAALSVADIGAQPADLEDDS